MSSSNGSVRRNYGCKSNILHCCITMYVTVPKLIVFHYGHYVLHCQFLAVIVHSFDSLEVVSLLFNPLNHGLSCVNEVFNADLNFTSHCSKASMGRVVNMRSIDNLGHDVHCQTLCAKLTRDPQ